MQFLLKLIISTLAILVTSYLLNGIELTSPWAALLLAAVLAFLNEIIKPILVILTIPVTVLSFGLFYFVINAGIVLLADYLVDGFSVKNFWWALGFSLILSLITAVFEGLSGRKNGED